MNRILWSIRNLLAKQSQEPSWYNFIQQFFGSHRMWAKFIQCYLPLQQSSQVLDLGCGTAEILQYLPENIDYIGIDSHEPYISACRKKYLNKGQFLCGSWNAIEEGIHVDYVLLLGLLHHLNDSDGRAVIKQAMNHLKPGGVLISLDACRQEDRSSFEEFFYRIDRGRFVRTFEQYIHLFPQKPTTTIHKNWIRVPYRYLVCQLRKT